MAAGTFAVPSTQLIFFAQQLERVIISAQLKRAFTVQIFALPHLPVDAPLTALRGYPMIDPGSQSRIITADEHITEVKSRKIYNFNPVCLVVWINNVSQEESTIDVIIESHDLFESDEPEKPLNTSHKGLADIMRKLAMPVIPDKFNGFNEVTEWIRNTYLFTQGDVAMSVGDSVKLMTTLTALKNLEHNPPKDLTAKTLWDELMRIFRGTPFEGFFSERTRQFILENIIGD